VSTDFNQQFVIRRMIRQPAIDGLMTFATFAAVSAD
jgi:hypothetical protein